ncbi:serine/threonine-protein kinase [Lacisediminihabitans changchengi]|uniref:non-specific serine/threonine protein kinase n=1 Tax=Lacisediminihabitans changchengi TaxID=2787634 RepID=A0A934SJW5_9MICO|nr:serine/threonine-protein kinase [Lacisediminihabitans changchengi]MBK4346257.1 serine/threonine protein kinase [Lacisediminihabitans changchengi]
MRRSTSQPPELPGYTFVKVLGSGGFSDVFLYEQKLPKRRVAVKVLLTEDLTPATRAAFVGEANLMAQLSTHPYIVTIYQADVASDDRPYFVMEYCSGPSLAERYKQETFEVADALRIGVRLSSAVATAHSAGILHRDIKPANVLTNDYGWPALTDFGISSAVEEDVLPLHTGTLADALAGAAGTTGTTGTSGTGASVGMSVPWSPPEMFDDDPEPDVRSDVFSLAATIYTILAGQTPFEVRGHSNGTLDLIGRIERGAITPFSRTDLPRSLVAVLRKGMASDRSDRFATALDFARALQRVELELGYAPTTIDVPNLHIEATARESDGQDADETRVRSVATVAIQPPIIQPPIIERPVPHPAQVESLVESQVESQVESTRLRAPVQVAVEETVMRPRETAQPPPPATSTQRESGAQAGAETGAEPDAHQPRRKRGALIGIAAAIVVIVIAAVLFFVVPQGGSTPAGPTAAPGGNGGVIDVSSVPAPTNGAAVASADGSTVTFTWTNPKPKKGDSFLWAKAESPTEQTPTDQPTAVVTGVVPGSKTCINVAVLRDGISSANPLAVCDR